MSRALAVGLALVAASAQAAPLDAARRAFLHGDYAAVEKLAKGAKPRDDAETLIARAEVRTGRYAEAEKRLLEVTKRSPSHLGARLELGRLYRATGRAADERAIWNAFFDDYEQGRIDKKSAAELTIVAVAARYLGSYNDANAVFHDAADADPKYAPAHLEWAATFLEKYAAGEAERDVDAALALAPGDPDALALQARVKIEQSYDVPSANRAIDAALAVNPRHADALALRGQLQLDNEEWDAAEKTARGLLSVNPKDAEAHTLLAAIRLLHDDRAGFDKEKQAVLAVNPRASGFYHQIAESFVKQHRYVEANALEAEALKLDPDYAPALAGIGQNWLRLGDEKQGLDALRRAFDRDGYNVRVFNLLKLFEEVIPSGYDFVDAPPFRVRVPKAEKEALARVVAPMVAEEWRELTKRYRFTPEGPLQIELFADPQHYAVRTTGLPGLDALGVTFGKIVTARSPAEGKFNWGMMLWHEIAHVFSIQLSKARVPRWFTEGLAEWETEHHRREWRRHTHAELAAALAEGKLLPVAQLNSGFTQARTLAGIVVAYHESAEAVAFLIRRFGFDKAVAALQEFAKGKETAEVIPSVTGLDCAAFDREFHDDLKKRLKAYDGSFAVRPSDYADLDGLAALAAAKPNDARVQALYALAVLHGAHDPKRANEIVQKAIDEHNPTREALFASAEILAANDNLKLALVALQKLIERGGDGFDARMALGTIYAREGQADDAVRELELAKTLDPESAEPYQVLAKMYVKAKRDDALVKELEGAAQLEVHDLSIAKLLVEKQLAAARWQKVREAAELAEWIDPLDVEVRAASARAALAMHDPKAAIAELETALAAHPRDRAKIDALMAEAKRALRAPAAR